MTRWFRFYDGAIHDTKILRLSDATFRAWVTLLCIASKNNGMLPTAADIAVELRCKPGLVAGWIAELTGAGLLDKTSDGFTPHNWSERQYKSDSSAERMKRHRDKKRDVTGDVTVTVQNRTETDTETEQISVANATGAAAPVDHRKRLFDEGLPKLAAISGKGPDACRAFVGKCLKAADDDAIVVLGLIEDAERNGIANPTAWIAAHLKGTNNGRVQEAQSLVSAARRHAEQGISFGPRPELPTLRSITGGADVRLLPQSGSDGPGDLCGGSGGGPERLSASGD